MKKSTFRRGPTSLVAGGALLAGAVLTQGCLQREVVEQSPNTSNVFVEQVANTAINEIDMLFVIDNSVSMGDKQEILKQAVPKMVERLVAPNCVDEDGNVVGQSVLQGADTLPVCQTGSLEFTPVSDIHLGVISSSLGGHGADTCPRSDAASNFDDRGRMIPTMRPNLTLNPGVGGLGFLEWVGGDETAKDTLIADFTDHVGAAGENGCGYEATLESWYRFLVDPNPPEEIVLDDKERATMRTDDQGNPLVDGAVLEQRKAFLRPEGLVAIVVLTDENDCSMMDGGEYYDNANYGYLLGKRNNSNGSEYRMRKATQICEENPNDRCCISCSQSSWPESCNSTVSASCGGDIQLQKDADQNGVRCFDNKRRFGVDLLYPTQRYVDALSKPEIVDARSGEKVDNPLIRGGGGKVRDPGLIFFAGIVGVPWQDIATPDSLDPAKPNVMRYLTAKALGTADVAVGDANVDRWSLILGQPGLPAGSQACDERDDPSCGSTPVAPLDPFMIESIVQRTAGATNPITGDAIVDASSNDPKANAINGHEADNTINDAGGGFAEYDDLQYACIFPLATPKDQAACAASASCDCAGEPSRNRSLCQPETGGQAEPAQYWGKAYPGTRILRVLKDFGDNSIVGSICPKITDPTQNDFGYNPAVQAIVDRLAEKLTGTCLPRELTIQDDGSVPCAVIEAKQPEDGEDPLDCSGPGRSPVDPGTPIRESVEKQLQDTGRCGKGTDIECSTYEMCQIDELLTVDDGRDECLYNTTQADQLSVTGFCYIDPAKQDADGNYIAGGSGSEQSGFSGQTGQDGTNAIVANCPAAQRRLLRFVGADTPAAGSITFVACTGDAASDDAPIPSAPTPTSMGGSGN